MSALYARFTSLEGGMNSGFDPAVISDKQYWLGINVVVRRGRPHTRPDFNRVSLFFDTDEEQAQFETGRFQGAKEYKPGNAYYLAVMISGRLFVIDVTTRRVFKIDVDRMNQYVPRCWFCQVAKYLIVQDGINRPIILDNLTGRKSSADDQEIPAGKVMAFGHGRIFLQISKRNFIAGDIYKFLEPDSALKFTEETYLAEGGAFSIDPELGEITGMHFATNLDTSTGDGPLLVCCSNGVKSYAVQYSRTQWSNLDISKVQLMDAGVVGPNAKSDVNQDLMFWSWEGLRSWAAIQQEPYYRRKYTNQSAELNEVIDDETAFILPYMSMIQFDNRLLITVCGEKVISWTDDEEALYDDYAFKAIASLDFDQINNQVSSESTKIVRSASYDGIWTGIHPTQLLAMYVGGVRRAFAFDKSRSGKNRLWEITANYTGCDNGNIPIEAAVYTKAFAGINVAYIEQPFSLKRLENTRLWVAGIRQRTPISLSVKNEKMYSYSHLKTRELNIVCNTTELTGDNQVQVGRPVNVGMLSFEDFDQDLISPRETLAISGYELSFKIAWKGYVEISRMLAEFTDAGQDSFIEWHDPLMINEPPEEKYNYRV